MVPYSIFYSCGFPRALLHLTYYKCYLWESFLKGQISFTNVNRLFPRLTITCNSHLSVLFTWHMEHVSCVSWYSLLSSEQCSRYYIYMKIGYIFIKDIHIDDIYIYTQMCHYRFFYIKNSSIAKIKSMNTQMCVYKEALAHLLQCSH